MHKLMKSKRKCLTLGILDPEVKHNLGGLGVLTAHTRKALKVKPKTQAFTDSVATGRADLYALDVGNTTSLAIYNLYGWTGAHQNAKQARRTDRLIASIQDEYYEQPTGLGDSYNDVPKW